MNYVRALDLRPGDIVYIPNSTGQWSQNFDKITSIQHGELSRMLTVYLEEGLNFRVFPNGLVPLVNITKPYNMKEEQIMKPLGKLDKATATAMVSLFSYSQLKLLKESLKNELDRIMEEERFHPSKTIEQLEEYNRRLNEWVKTNDTITRTMIYLGE